MIQITIPQQLYETWKGLKRSAQWGARFSEGELHVHIGLLIFCVAFWMLRKSSRAPLYAFLIVCAAQSLNEIIDYLASQSMSYPLTMKGVIKDFLRTIFWPVILMVALFIMHPDYQLKKDRPPQN